MHNQHRLPAHQYALYFLLAAGFVLLIAPHNAEHVIEGKLQDPDSYMRLVRIQEALDHRHWFGDVVSGDLSGLGDVLSWSHLLDGFILLLRAPLRLLFPPGEALLWAGAVTGPLSVGLLGMFCAWAVAPVAQRAWLWIAPVGVAAAPAIINYGRLGCVTHHIALAALAVGAWGAGGRAAFGSVRAGALTGLFIGIGIWLSPEAMPFGMMAFGAILLSWAVRPAPLVASSLAAAGSMLVVTIALALLLDPPPAGRTVPQLDRLSVTFLCQALIVCALCWLPRGLGAVRLSAASRFILLGSGLAAGTALWLALFPGYLRGLAGLVTQEQAAAFFGNIAEWRPLNTPSYFCAFALAGILAAVGALALAIRPERDLPALLWAFAGLCSAGGTLLAFLHARFAPYPAAGAAMLLPVLLSLSALRRRGPLVRPGLVAAFLCAPLFLGWLLTTAADTGRLKALQADQARCPMQAAAALLAPYPGAIVLADVNDGPELLYRTKVKIVGSLYHSGIAGFMRLRAAWRARDLDHVPPALQATGAEYILVCPGASRMDLVDGPATTLSDRLNDGDPPAWLHPVTHEPGSDWTLYGIAPAH